jgi:hypothetical protein
VSTPLTGWHRKFRPNTKGALPVSSFTQEGTGAALVDARFAVALDQQQSEASTTQQSEASTTQQSEASTTLQSEASTTQQSEASATQQSEASATQRYSGADKTPQSTIAQELRAVLFACIINDAEFMDVRKVGAELHGARFATEIYTRGVPLSFTPLIRLKRCHA